MNNVIRIQVQIGDMQTDESNDEVTVFVPKLSCNSQIALANRNECIGITKTISFDLHDVLNKAIQQLNDHMRYIPK